MSKSSYNPEQLNDLLLQMMETELGGEQVYLAALESVQNADLKEEFQGYLEETRTHQEIVQSMCEALGLDPTTQTPSRQVVKHLGDSLVQAIQLAQQSGSPASAELTACECVVLAETKDHSNWELLGQVAEAATGEVGKVLRAAHAQVEKQEDHHMYHSKGWCRELWIQALGMPAVLPPPEEVKQVETAIGASRAEQQRDTML